ncbi:MAG: ATP-binding cassette domain-containing protein [Lawsonella clevelandensis]
MTINGAPTTSINPDDLRAAVTEVSQASHLFNTSIAESLRLARTRCHRRRAMGGPPHRRNRPRHTEQSRGLDTPVGEFGTELSGGQVQRLTIARALLTDAQVLVLDEYTSHLNQELAHQVGEQIKAARPNATIIEITTSPPAPSTPTTSSSWKKAASWNRANHTPWQQQEQHPGSSPATLG